MTINKNNEHTNGGECFFLIGITMHNCNVNVNDNILFFEGGLFPLH